MAPFRAAASVEAKAVITFGERELRALDAMTGYGIDSFLDAFYKHLGKHYMQPYEADLRALFATLNPPVSEALAKVDEARRVLDAAAKKKAEAANGAKD
ncbi:hypothetical protein [Pseudovibrio sp. POLY-S9]|uniref:hypothetical protein n=1 Tax=Pseudovibrio sp. POLY-S9 TaxID=1576596 RepID=UPI00070BAF13|nr:hypothetical protein [Pseudovibrio sp. POLY-S9]